MKKIYLIVGAIILLLVGLLFVRFFIGGDEDSWIKDSKGVWIKHGNPDSVHENVKEQQNAISCAENLYEQEKTKGIEFNSQCLEICGNYAVDIVHVPRADEDNKAENQCENYRQGKVKHFIELDKDGNVVRVV